MHATRLLFAGALAVIFSAAAWSGAPAVTLTIDVAHPGHAVSPTLHGVFFEDINYGADGGLYAELVQNRSFEHTEHLYAWGTVNRGGDGDVTIETAEPLNAKNPHYARLTVRDPGKGFGLGNYGFGGIAVKSGENYLVSLRARADAAAAGGALTAVLEDESGRPLGECRLAGLGSAWTQLDGTIKCGATATSARLVVLATTAGRLDLDVVSLFPENTWKHRRNGLRADLVQMLADLHPAFMRFPGGCIVEGRDLPNRYQWKDTIGDVAGRPENWNRWQDAVSNTAPQYCQTYGLGFFEYFQLCEDLGAEPLPLLNCGMACQYQSKQLVPLDQLDPYVQDALDLIEFANGPVTGGWGAQRAAMGHPEPFHLKYLGVGNEQWGEDYFARYKIFQAALKAKHPELQLVTPAGPGVDDVFWKLAWDKFRSGTPADIVDEHYYRPPQWFLENATRYDAQDRAGPKVFAGEFAAHERDRRSTLRAALAEAAFMTGLVRNSDLVVMSSYAPLFAKAGAWQWAPDLIWFDNTHVYGTPSYYVQQLFSRHRPDRVVPVTVAGPAVTLPPLPAREIATHGASSLTPYKPASIPALFAAGGLLGSAGEVVVIVVNPYAEARATAIDVRGVKNIAPDGKVIVLTSTNPDDENSFETPTKVAPREQAVTVSGPQFPYTFPANSLTILRLKTEP
jgi:alpha-L-arabinofuranosidase